jgi:hypothetical protein
MRMSCIIITKLLNSRTKLIKSGTMTTTSFFNPCFIEKRELRMLCQTEQSADSHWKSSMRVGNVLLKHESETEAFNEFGCAFQVAQHQLIRVETPSWRWAMRLVETTNLLVVVLGRWGYQGLVRDLLTSVQHQLAAISNLADCPCDRNAKWLCVWCQSMTCPKRQASIERLYIQNEPNIPAGLMH